jgi:hypothetical protein
MNEVVIMAVQITVEQRIAGIKATIVKVEMEVAGIKSRALKMQKQKELLALYNELKECMKIKNDLHLNMLTDSERYFDHYDNDEESYGSPDYVEEADGILMGGNGSPQQTIDSHGNDLFAAALVRSMR